MLIVTIIGLLSTGIAQIIACSADTYYIDNSTSKRCGARLYLVSARPRAAARSGKIPFPT